MTVFELLLVSVGLASDAFAVAMCAGTTGHGRQARPALRLSFHLGLFQFLMPVIGWYLGIHVQKYVASFDHWIAFGLLVFVGGHMLYESFQDENDRVSSDPTKGMRMVALSVACSIDALAVGLSLAMLGVTVWYPSVMFGVITAALSLLGVMLGTRLRGSFGRRVEQLGGLVLIAIGMKILFVC